MDEKRTILLRHYLYVPVIYFVSILPCWLLGRDLKELLRIYIDQSGYYPWGTLNYPNVYTLLGEAMPDLRHADQVSGAGTAMTILLLGCIAYYLYTSRVRLTDEICVSLALFTVALIVYTLPHMHDRYGFLIDLFAIIYGVYNVRRLPICCGFYAGVGSHLYALSDCGGYRAPAVYCHRASGADPFRGL